MERTQMTTPRVQRIAQYLMQHGVASTVQIAKALGETTERVAASIQHERNRNRWGIVKLGRDPNAVHRSTLLWTIDTSLSGTRRAPRKPTLVAKPSDRTPGLTLIPDGPYKTKWQPVQPWSQA